MGWVFFRQPCNGDACTDLFWSPQYSDNPLFPLICMFGFINIGYYFKSYQPPIMILNI
ncbi:hypothetical protein Hanom_Chr14g01284041 [Helianthus anomalus]